MDSLLRHTEWWFVYKICHIAHKPEIQKMSKVRCQRFVYFIDSTKETSLRKVTNWIALTCLTLLMHFNIFFDFKKYILLIYFSFPFNNIMKSINLLVQFLSRISQWYVKEISVPNLWFQNDLGRYFSIIQVEILFCPCSFCLWLLFSHFSSF